MHCRTQPDLPAQIHQWDQESPLHTIPQRASAETLHEVVTSQLPSFLPGPRAALHTENSQMPASRSLSQDAS